MNRYWRAWAKALGSKSGDTDHESDSIAFIRTILVLLQLTASSIIVAGVIRHW